MASTKYLKQFEESSEISTKARAGVTTVGLLDLIDEVNTDTTTDQYAEYVEAVTRCNIARPVLNELIDDSIPSTVSVVVNATGCTASGAGDYDIGTNVTITFTPNANYTFKSCTVNGESATVTNNTLTIQNIQENVSVVVVYELVTYTVTITPSAQYTCTGAGTYYSGSEVICTVTPSSGYWATQYTINGVTRDFDYVGSKSFSFTITSDTTISLVCVKTAILTVESPGSETSLDTEPFEDYGGVDFTLEKDTTVAVTSTPWESQGMEPISVKVDGASVSYDFDGTSVTVDVFMSSNRTITIEWP